MFVKLFSVLFCMLEIFSNKEKERNNNFKFQPGQETYLKPHITCKETPGFKPSRMLPDNQLFYFSLLKYSSINIVLLIA